MQLIRLFSRRPCWCSYWRIGAGYGAIDDENQATGDDVNPLEGWERDTNF